MDFVTLTYAKHLYRAYNLLPSDYYIMFIQQNFRCYLCKKLPTKRMLVVDHNHQTGEVRKLLCDRCNGIIGFLEKTPKELRDRMLDYIRIDK